MAKEAKETQAADVDDPVLHEASSFGGFVLLVKRMRESQMRAADSMLQAAHTESREYERRVDELIMELSNGQI